MTAKNERNTSTRGNRLDGFQPGGSLLIDALRRHASGPDIVLPGENISADSFAPLSRSRSFKQSACRCRRKIFQRIASRLGFPFADLRTVENLNIPRLPIREMQTVGQHPTVPAVTASVQEEDAAERTVSGNRNPDRLRLLRPLMTAKHDKPFGIECERNSADLHRLCLPPGISSGPAGHPAENRSTAG